jgi:hypothetical protein
MATAARTCSPARSPTTPVTPASAETSGDHFDTDAPLYRRIAEMARIRAAEPACAAAARSCAPPATSLACSPVSRMDGQPGETLVLFNSGPTPIDRQCRGRDDLARNWQPARRLPDAHGARQLSG